MTTPKLTIGFATYLDYHGAYFTLQDLRLHHASAMPHVEFVVVDQSPPNHAHAKTLKNLVEGWVNNHGAAARYVSMPKPKGTSPSRQRVFDEAKASAVLCIDSHVLLGPGALTRLLAYYDANPETNDLIQGPLLYDGLRTFVTHMEPQWREEMFGTWAVSWECRECGSRYVVEKGQKGNRSAAVFLPSSIEAVPRREMRPVMECACGKTLPDVPYEGHEKALSEAGFRLLGESIDDAPFQIPLHGLGLFSCRKAAWDAVGGFNPGFRGFGGEEGYIHAKFQAAGGKTLCMPWLRWLHRFGRPDGVPYPLSRQDKVRNYVLGWGEIGWPVEDVKAHFCTRQAGDGAPGLKHPMSEQEFARIAEAAGQTPPDRDDEPQPQSASGTGGAGIDEIFVWLKSQPRDLDQHMDTLRDYASRCEHVTEFGTRRESLVALAAGRPKTLISHNTENDPVIRALHAAVEREGAEGKEPRILKFSTSTRQSLTVGEIEETDLLFLDTKHNANQLSQELAAYLPKTRRYLILHDTTLFGEKGDDNNLGLLHPLRSLIAEGEWFIAFHTDDQYGLTVLSRDAAERPEFPMYAWDPGHGPGTELKAILASLDIMPGPNCDCNKKAAQMNKWGVGGCKANFETIVQWLNDGQHKWGWKSKMKAAGKAVTSGLAFKLNPLDPFPGIIKECIKRAEEKLAESTAPEPAEA